MTFTNKSDNQFVVIDTEEYRTYIYERGELTIQHPEQLSVSDSGGHRVFDGEFSYYVAPGWRAIKWKAKDGAAHFVK